MIGAQSDSIGTDAGGSEPVDGDEYEDPVTRVLQEVRLVSVSIADECAASAVGSIHPSSDGTICSELRAGAAVGVISRTPSDGRAKSCLSRLCGAPDMGSNPSKIKSLRMSAT